MGSYPSSKEVGDVLLIKVKRNRKGEERWEINMQWICLRKKKVYKSASSSYHFPQRRKPLFRCQYESH